MLFHGVQVIQSEFLTVPGEPITETRRYTWLQRLLTADCPPWQSTYTVTYRLQVPHPGFVRIGDTYVCHPVTYQKLRDLQQRDAEMHAKKWDL